MCEPSKDRQPYTVLTNAVFTVTLTVTKAPGVSIFRNRGHRRKYSTRTSPRDPTCPRKVPAGHSQAVTAHCCGLYLKSEPFRTKSYFLANPNDV